MIDQLLQKVDTFIDENHMLKSGDHVVLGISGGADSMCLLFVLERLREKYGVSLTAVHVNHGLRGAAADADEAYVKKICCQWGVECICFRADIHALAKKEKMTEEEAGRKYRYECFEQVRLEKKADKVAVAHHINDLAETVMFNLFRGSQLKGIGGIAPVRGNIIRPLLGLDRSEIELILDAEHISYRVDQTNFDTLYTRNKIRLELLPYVCSQINAQAVPHIAAAAAAAREAYEFIHREAIKAMENVVDGDGQLFAHRLTALDKVLQKEVIRLWFEKKTGRLKDVTKDHVESILGLAYKGDGRQISLPYGLTAVRRGHMLCLEETSCRQMKKKCNGAGDGHKSPEAAGHRISDRDIDIEVTVPSSVYLDEMSVTVTFEIAEKKENQIIPENGCTKWLDYDKINDGLKLRHRRQGDFMTIAPSCSKKLVRRIMIDDKIPKSMREKVWLLADGEHILWMLGGRISEHYKITDDTRKILIVKIKGEKTCQTKSKYY